MFLKLGKEILIIYKKFTEKKCFLEEPFKTGFIKTTPAHQPTDHVSLTHGLVDYLLTDPPPTYHELPLKQRPDSKHVLWSKDLENFRNHLFYE